MTPLGSSRMTMMTAMSRPIWPKSWPCQDVSARLDDGEEGGGGCGSEEDVSPADHDGDEGLHDEGRAHGRHHRHGRRVEAAGQARERRADAEGQGIDAPRVDAEGIRHVRHLDRGAGKHAEARLVEDEKSSDQDQHSGGDQHAGGSRNRTDRRR